MRRANFGAALRARRVSRNLSLADLAERIGYSRGLISRVETGAVAPSRDFTAACCRVLGADLDWIPTDGAGAESAPAQAKPKEPFETFYARQFSPLRAFVRANGVVGEAAESIVQDVLLACFTSWSKLTTPDAFARVVVRNQIREHWRREERRRVELAEQDMDELATRMTAPSAETVALSMVTWRSYLEPLSEQQRFVVGGVVAGWSTAEIARRAAMSPAAVNAAMKRVRSRLRLTAELESAKARHDIGDRRGEGRALDSASAGLLREHREGEALRILQRAADAYRDASMSVDAGHALVKIGVMMLAKGKATKSATVFRAAVSAFREAGDEWRRGHACMHLGHAHRTTGDLVAAAQAYEAASAAFETAADRGNREAAREVARAAESLRSRNTDPFVPQAITSQTRPTRTTHPSRDERTRRVGRAGNDRVSECSYVQNYLGRLRGSRVDMAEGVNTGILFLWHHFEPHE
ncbi:helix-turn-helix domain-containing protein [Amycolatopsis japonica]|uniref:helix-turn-helix domain-containing protein n=1 Tax=Amycolatopsis japonica TaxID=208439 RepID=UPI0033218708